jgi:hypothetical protein
LLGDIRARGDRHADAARHYRRALELAEAPRPADVLACADAYARAGRLEDALAALALGEARLGSVVTLQRRALALEVQAGRHGAALARVERLRAASVQPAPWLLEKARILAAQGDGAGARQAARDGLDAIARLPEGRRRVPAMQELAASLRALAGDGGSGGR